MDDEAAPFALASGEGERLVFGDVTVLIRASCETTGGAFTIFEEGPPLLDTPRHVHANEDEVFHVSKGRPLWITQGVLAAATVGAAWRAGGTTPRNRLAFGALIVGAVLLVAFVGMTIAEA